MKRILFIIVVLVSMAMRPVVIVDRDTRETLVGVSVSCGDSIKMTDMDGNVGIGSGVDSILVSYVSYESKRVFVSDTIMMVRVGNCLCIKDGCSTYLSLRK